MRGKRDGGGASNPTLSMLEVWWPGPRGEDVLRAKFRSLEDATRYVWRHDRVLEASVRFPSGEVRWARELDAPPLPPRVFRERPVDGAKLTREVCDRLPHLHEDDVAVVVRATMYVLTQWQGTANEAPPPSQPSTVREPTKVPR